MTFILHIYTNYVTCIKHNTLPCASKLPLSHDKMSTSNGFRCGWMLYIFFKNFLGVHEYLKYKTKRLDAYH